MTKAKLTATSALTPPIGIVVIANDGGVGKTHTTIHLLTAFRLLDLPVETFQLDTKATLEQKTGEPVTTLVVPDHRQTDDGSMTDIIVPWYQAWTAMSATGRSVVLEVGGALAALFHAGCADLDVEEDIHLLAAPLVAVIVTKAGGDAAAQLVRELRRWQRAMPGAEVLIVLNEMSGCPVQAAQYLEPAVRKAFLEAVERYPTLRMPRLNGRAMALYERLPALPSTIVSWHADNYAQAIARTNRPRDEAKRFVRDLAIWTGSIQEQLPRVLPFLAEGPTHG